VIILLCLSAVMLAAFAWWELRAPQPLLDLRFFRVRQFTVANVVAFCTYFATFAIFFFTALYLNEVVAASGYRLAATFLPMTVLMIAASVLAGRWTQAAGPRWSITIGCVLFAGGLVMTDAFLSPHPSYAGLTVALALAGIGIGTTVVPITSAALSAVPPERSGMAASANNTAREIGAVTGVAVLGSLVYSQLRTSLVTQMNHLGVPPSFRGLVVNAIETGQIPQNTNAYAGFGKLVQEVIGAAYTAFGDGLRAALYLSAGLVILAGLLSFITLRSRPVDSGS
jgi:predicted MFS family arabinose efflux permease